MNSHGAPMLMIKLISIVFHEWCCWWNGTEWQCSTTLNLYAQGDGTTVDSI